MTASGMSGGPRSSGVSSYLPYIVIIALAGGVFVYRGKIMEMVKARKERKSGIPKPMRRKTENSMIRNLKNKKAEGAE